MDYDADDTDRSLIAPTNGVVNWQEIIVKQSRVNGNLQLHQLVTVVESGKWPTPEEIELLRAEVVNMRFTIQVPFAHSRDDIETDLEPDEFTLVSQFCEHCQLMVRILSGLAVLARYSLRETESLLRLEPLAWSRLLAEARFYQNSSISQTEQAIQTPSPRSQQSRAWPGCNDWHNWGIGVDENGRWHFGILIYLSKTFLGKTNKSYLAIDWQRHPNGDHLRTAAAAFYA